MQIDDMQFETKSFSLSSRKKQNQERLKNGLKSTNRDSMKKINKRKGKKYSTSSKGEKEISIRYNERQWM